MPTRITCDTPSRAGIYARNTTLGTNCTSSFLARDGNIYGFLTAEHCGNNGHVYKIGNQADSFQTQIREAQSHDAAFVRLRNSQGRIDNALFKNSNHKQFQVTAREPNHRIDQGDYVCVFSYEFGRACGNIQDANFNSIPVPNPVDGASNTYWNQFRVSVSISGQWVCSPNDGGGNNISGASGGAVTNGNGRRAVGIVSSCFGPTTSFAPVYDSLLNKTTVHIGVTKIQNAELSLGVNILTS